MRGRTQLSVTEIEHWLRDPYTIYAQAYSQGSTRSTPIDTQPGARDRGTVIHGAIGDFTKRSTRPGFRPIRSRR